MSKLALLPFVTATGAAMLTWASAKYLKILHEQRAQAALRPRARPYGTSLPRSLTKQ